MGPLFATGKAPDLADARKSSRLDILYSSLDSLYPSVLEERAKTAKMEGLLISFEDRLRGTFIGTAVGDALGLPAEGLSRKRVARLYPGPWRHRFVFGLGMISDDTEHTILVAQALLRRGSKPEAFAHCLAWKLRWWLPGLPAGIGLATLRSILKLWLGFPPSRSGVYSAGNGPAMRSAILGACFATDPESRKPAEISHTREVKS